MSKLKNMKNIAKEADVIGQEDKIGKIEVGGKKLFKKNEGIKKFLKKKKKNERQTKREKGRE